MSVKCKKYYIAVLSLKMADQDNGTLSDLALSTPPNVLSSKSSDISIEELGMEESDAIEAQLELNSGKVPEDAAKSSEDTDTKSSHVEASGTKEEKDTIENESKEETDNSKISDQNDDKNKSEENVVSIIGQIKDDSDEEDEEDEFDDETLMERVLGLSEMFPPGLTKSLSTLGCKSVDGTKWVYSTGRNLTWMLFSTAAILFLPAMLESERVGFEEMEKVKRQQILLGPSSAMAAPATNAPLPPTPS